MPAVFISPYFHRHGLSDAPGGVEFPVHQRSEIAMRNAAPRNLITTAIVGIAVLAGVPVSGAQVGANPGFAPDYMTAWVPSRLAGDDFLPPKSGPGPVVSDDPAIPIRPIRVLRDNRIPGRRPEQPDPAAVGQRTDEESQPRSARRQNSLHGARAVLARRGS